jgi:hypothetical protein
VNCEKLYKPHESFTATMAMGSIEGVKASPKVAIEALVTLRPVNRLRGTGAFFI